LAGFWAPYTDAADAGSRIKRFADTAIDPRCGIGFSDGASFAVVRRPTGGRTEQQKWLTILVQHVAAPRPSPPPNGRLQKLEAWINRAMEIQGEQELQAAQTQAAASEAISRGLRDDVWLPAHQFLLRHKLVADGIGVGIDVIGAVAAGFFIVAAAPELLGGAAVIGTTGLVTGVPASIGAIVLLVADGLVFGGEMTGHEVLSKKIEDNKTIQWMRIGATIMLLPDIAVGGVRALKEIGALGSEAREAEEASKLASARSAAERTRASRIHNPERHSSPVQRHLHRARTLAREAQEHLEDAQKAQARIHILALRDLNASFVGTPGGTALLAAAPPGIVLNKDQVERDEKYMQMLTPEGGMPNDTRLEIRIMGFSKKSSA
jgi:hypothetical protein